MNHLVTWKRLLVTSLCLPLINYTSATYAQEEGATATPEVPVKPLVLKENSYLRIKKNKQDQPMSMQTSILRYVFVQGDRDVIVDLVGVVHIGDYRYYEQLNDEFESYDAVLYELVAPKEKNVPKRGGPKNQNMLSVIMDIGKILFELEHQLDHIDYTKKNFVHADLSPQEMAQKIKDRGDNAFTIFLGMMMDMMRQQNLAANQPAREYPQLDLTQIVRDPNGAVVFKRVLADQLATSLQQSSDPNSTMHRLLIADRNKAAMDVLEKELAKGTKRICVFYGAAHLPDFEQRLKLRFGMKKQSERWLTAWDLRQTNKSDVEHLQKFIRIADILRRL